MDPGARLARDGFVVFRGAVPPQRCAAWLAHARSLGASAFAAIFNTPRENRRRLQHALAPGEEGGVLAAAAAVLARLAPVLADDCEPKNAVLIRSLPRCGDQRLHRDYPAPDATSANALTRLSVLVAIQAGTRLRLAPGTHAHDYCVVQTHPTVLSLDPGDVVVLSGGLIHGGANYDTDHYRIHCYASPRGEPPPPFTDWTSFTTGPAAASCPPGAPPSPPAPDPPTPPPEP